MHPSGAYLHGTKADLAVGDRLVPGRESNYEAGRIMNHVGIHWDELDEDISIAGLLAGQGDITHRPHRAA